MVFPFTFSVSTIPNPFTTQRAPEPDLTNSSDMRFGGGDPNPRKRAWLPATSSLVPSLAVSSATSEPGYLDTPSKYLEAAARASGPGEDADEQEHGPPAKKRRTIADSIISTALSAALIGTAVGIAAYRVWRDRGKPAQQQAEAQLQPEHEEKQPPPPPYHPGDWVSVSQESQPQQAAHTLPKAARRTRRTHAAGHRRKTSHLHVPRHTPPPPAFAPRSHSPRLAAASEAGGAEPEFEDHVDWMSSQLARLIEQGKRALGQEVVLPSDAEDAGHAPVEEEDENAWVDDEQPSSSTSYSQYHAASPSSSYHYSSMRHGRTSPYLNTPPRSPLSASYPFGAPLPPSASSASLRTPVSARLATADEPGLSPELREHMARARAARGL